MRLERVVAAAGRHYYLLTSALMFLSFPSYDTVFLKAFPLFAWVFLVPLLVYARGKSLKEVYISSLVAGVLGNAAAYSWIGQFGNNVPGGDAVIMLFIVPCLSIFFSSKILFAEFLSRRFERVRLLVFPSVWIAVDGIQSIGHLAFPWTYLGYSQFPFTSFIQISSFTGVFGVSFILVCSNCVFSDFIHAVKAGGVGLRQSLSLPAFRSLAAVVSIVACCILYGAVTLADRGHRSQDRLRVATVQSCIDPWADWSGNKYRYLEELKRLTLESLAKEPEFIVWSESATLELISFNYERGSLNTFEWEVLRLASDNKKPILTGEIGIRQDPYGRRIHPQNNAVLINEHGEVVTSYAKMHLVPFGEWFPYEKWLPWVKKIIDSFGASSFMPGDTPSLFHVKGKAFGALVCYEGIFFRLCRQYKALGADFFVNITNLGWTDTYKGHMQGFASAAFRAVENGIWFVSAGNTGYSALVDPYGRITASIPILKPGYLAGDLDFSLNHATVYSSVGDVILYASILFVIILTSIAVIEKIRARSAA